MIGRKIQGLEIVEIRLDFRAKRHLKAHVGENGLDFGYSCRKRMIVAFRHDDADCTAKLAILEVIFGFGDDFQARNSLQKRLNGGIVPVRMEIFEEVVLYTFLFVGIYFQVFVLFTYLISRKQIKTDGKRCFERAQYPSVAVIVPVWNEEKTLAKTLDSLLNLSYPKEKLKIVVVNDGSTDKTAEIMERYKKLHPQIETFGKENGGKHTAVNYGITHTDSDLIGCLDADSFVEPCALKKMTCVFENPNVMAVTPALKIYRPKTIVQMIQSAEYVFGILVKKVMGLIGAIHVTPGPFTVFRRDVFSKIGLFRKAHNTEDMEFAFRMQANHLQIENVHNAWVYTTGPNTVKKLYRQRLRWTHGFLENAKDYKYLFFNKKYGNVGIITLPVGLILIIGVVFSVFFIFYRIINWIVAKFIEWRTVGFLQPHLSFSFFYVSTRLHIVLIVSIYLLMVMILLSAYKLAEERAGKNILLYFVFYPFISPFWVIKSMWNTVFSKKTSWR